MTVYHIWHATHISVVFYDIISSGGFFRGLSKQNSKDYVLIHLFVTIYTILVGKFLFMMLTKRGWKSS